MLRVEKQLVIVLGNCSVQQLILGAGIVKEHVGMVDDFAADASATYAAAATVDP